MERGPWEPETGLHPDPPPPLWPHGSREGSAPDHHCPVTGANCMLLFSFLSGSSCRCQFRPSSFQASQYPQTWSRCHLSSHQNSGLLKSQSSAGLFTVCPPCTLDQMCFITKSGTCSLLHPGAFYDRCSRHICGTDTGTGTSELQKFLPRAPFKREFQ